MHKMLDSGNGDKKWREKMMEGEDGVKRTIECLRGRLLAERVASKAAKEEAEFMGNKLIMLEKQLKSEIESRDRAEKKLKFLKKKMEYMKLAPVLDHCRSSSTISSGFQDPEEQNRGCPTLDSVKRCSSSGKEMTDSLTSETIGNNDSESCPLHHQAPSIRENSSSVGTAHSCNSHMGTSKELNKTEDLLKEELTINDIRQASTGEKEIIKDKNSVELVDNTSPLVPENIWPASQNTELQIKEDNVGDVVAALRHEREKIRSSIGRRDITFSHSIKFCSNA